MVPLPFLELLVFDPGPAVYQLSYSSETSIVPRYSNLQGVS
jgi:hypothetical protein